MPRGFRREDAIFVKICGTTSLLDAELAIASGANAVGFVFAPSKRQVSVQKAAEITAELPDDTERVGVFCAPDPGGILHAVREAGLTAVQLHMAQDPRLIEALTLALPSKVKLWQVVSFELQPLDPISAERNFLHGVLAAMMEPRISAVLLDASKQGNSGGTGESFSWERAAPLVRQAEEMAKLLGGSKEFTPAPVIVAGGLSAENVAEAIQIFAPMGVDCVSGVEAEPGRKDQHRLMAFVRAARTAG